jgi:hypothetical protein
MSDPIDKLAMPASVVDALVKALSDQLVRDIVADNYRRAAPIAAPPQSVTDALVERFAPSPP